MLKRFIGTSTPDAGLLFARLAGAALLLWVHGGPVHSWNGWSWRWNPHLMAARGYAVLLPDPALSTGYGQEFVQRGWGAWGSAPYTDLMAATDAAEALLLDTLTAMETGRPDATLREIISGRKSYSGAS